MKSFLIFVCFVWTRSGSKLKTLGVEKNLAIEAASNLLVNVLLQTCRKWIEFGYRDGFAAEHLMRKTLDNIPVQVKVTNNNDLDEHLKTSTVLLFDSVEHLYSAIQREK